jgi:hypothetical protein
VSSELPAGPVAAAGYWPPGMPWQTALPGPFDAVGVTVYPGNWPPGNRAADVQSGVPGAAAVAALPEVPATAVQQAGPEPPPGLPPLEEHALAAATMNHKGCKNH